MTVVIYSIKYNCGMIKWSFSKYWKSTEQFYIAYAILKITREFYT